MKIETLTPEQQALLPGIRDEWIAHGLSTDRANRPEAEEGVRMAYRAAGLEPPRVIIWVDSPYAGALAQAIAPPLIAQAMGGGDQVRDQVWAQVWAQVRDQVGDQVRAQVRDQVGDQVRAQVRDQVRAQVRDQVRSWSAPLIGDYYSTYWAAWIDAMDQLGVQGLAPFRGIQQVARNAFWWWVFKHFAIITERPSELHRDNQNRLHNEGGPAIAWPDGWALHSWHGTRVPADMIATDWSIDRILAEPNAEIRRCAIEKIGWSRFIGQSGMTLVDTAPDPGNPPHVIELYDLPDSLTDMYAERARILLCTNGTVERDGTRRHFGLPVPAHHSDPVAAAADLYDWPVEAYRQLQHRR